MARTAAPRVERIRKPISRRRCNCWRRSPARFLEVNTSLLHGTGQLTQSGLRRTPDGGLNASWALSRPEQQAAGVEPIVLQAYFGRGFHHPHLRGTTVRDWPLNVFSDEDATAQLPYSGRSRRAIYTSRLPVGLSDRSRREGKSRQFAQRCSNVMLAIASSVRLPEDHWPPQLAAR